MGISLERKIVVGPTRFTSGQRGRRRGRSQQSWQNQVTLFMRSRNIEEDMVNFFGVWEWIDDSQLYR